MSECKAFASNSSTVRDGNDTGLKLTLRFKPPPDCGAAQAGARLRAARRGGARRAAGHAKDPSAGMVIAGGNPESSGLRCAQEPIRSGKKPAPRRSVLRKQQEKSRDGLKEWHYKPARNPAALQIRQVRA